MAYRVIKMKKFCYMILSLVVLLTASCSEKQTVPQDSIEKSDNVEVSASQLDENMSGDQSLSESDDAGYDPSSSVDENGEISGSDETSIDQSNGQTSDQNGSSGDGGIWTSEMYL